VRRLLPLAICALLLPGAARALYGSLPLGGDQGQHTGIDAAASFLNDDLPDATVYDHWLGWELAYYLGPQPRVTIRYSPQPEALADDFAAQNDVRYLIAPSAWEAAPWLDALRRAGADVATVYQDQHGFAVFRLAPPHNGQRAGGAVYSE